MTPEEILQSVDLPPPSSCGRVVVAMSGGVDSSVVAALLAYGGYDVVGITLQLYDQGARAARKGACCAGQDIYDAKTVAETIGFPHYVLDYESRFRETVINDFAESYLRGETPVPCIQCNREVKFKDLLQTARDLGAQALATGHYVRRIEGHSGAQLHQAIDLHRDQSYFLFGTTQEQLEFLRFPLGGLPKSATRDLAAFLGLGVSEKPDSQDICFVAGGSYADVVARLRPESLIPGDIVHQDGRILGTHQGIIHFTIGQRRGLGISAPEPLFVIRLDPKTHQVIVGPQSALARTTLTLKEVNWIGPQDFPKIQDINVKIRSSHRGTIANLRLTNGGKSQVILNTPEYGIAQGQACVFYGGTRVLGGGWIESTS